MRLKLPSKSAYHYGDEILFKKRFWRFFYQKTHGAVIDKNGEWLLVGMGGPIFITERLWIHKKEVVGYFPEEVLEEAERRRCMKQRSPLQPR